MWKTLLHELMMQAVSLAVNLCCGTHMCHCALEHNRILGQQMHCCMVHGKLW
jgi:hypothetical protein